MTQNIITVSDVTKIIKNLLETNYELVALTVSGEISNLTIHRTGHLYFAIKDENSVLNAVMFRGNVSSLKFKPQNGMKIIAKGRISVFEPTGRYQLVVSSMEQDGIGDLYVAFEQLKKKLEAEGLFSQTYKKQIPKIPKCVGVITSPTGAAVRDIINVLGRRFPYSNILLYPSLVQGDGAPVQLIKALKYFESAGNADVIIIGRGGGSIEDLWAFNNEELARCIFDMTIPVISAVGHETDFTICDFVSDVRAPTPSAAAELAVPNTDDMLTKFENVNKRLKLILGRNLDNAKQRYIRLAKSRVLNDPSYILDNRQLLADYLTEKLYSNANVKLSNSESQLMQLTAKMDALSPLKIMGRGFLFAKTSDDKVLKSVNDITEKEKINLRLCDGNAYCTIDKIIKESNNG